MARELCRARADVVDERDRARKRQGVMLRHARVSGGQQLAHRHVQWLAAQRFDEPMLRTTFDHYPGGAGRSGRRGRRYRVRPEGVVGPRPVQGRRPPAGRLPRDADLGALTLASEVCDWRRFGRATAFMGFLGLVPSGYSSGACTRRKHLPTGNAHLRTQLVKSAWAYQHRAQVRANLRARQQAWTETPTRYSPKHRPSATVR